MRFFLYVCVAFFSCQALYAEGQRISSIVSKYHIIDPVRAAKFLMTSSSFVNWVALYNNVEPHTVSSENILELEVERGISSDLRRELANGRISRDELRAVLFFLNGGGGVASQLRQLFSKHNPKVDELNDIAAYMEKEALATELLLAATYRGDAKEVTKLLLAGADVNATLNPQTARHLIDFTNNDMTISDYGKPAIELATIKQHHEVAEILRTHIKQHHEVAEILRTWKF